MLRIVFLAAFLGLIGFGIYTWAFPDPEASRVGKGKQPLLPGQAGGDTDRPTGDAAAGKGLPQRRASSRLQPAIEDAFHLPEPVVIADARLAVIEFPEVASQRGGRLLFLGREPPAGTADASIDGTTLSILAVKTTQAEADALKEEAWPALGSGQFWRPWRDIDPLDLKAVKMVPRGKTYQTLREGMDVRKGELLGLIDPALAVAELIIKLAKFNTAEAELRASLKKAEESQRRYVRADVVYRNRAGSVEDRDLAKLQWDAAIEEGKKAEAGVDQARSEVVQADKVLKLHEIRAPISGTVRRLYKQPGETVKEQENVLRVENLERLQAEGVVEVQDARRLAVGMPVMAEPAKPEAPALVLRGHREPVVAVAAARGAQPLAVSTGKDRTILWGLRLRKDPATGKETWSGFERAVLDHPAAVRTLACAPAGDNLCFLGAADGSGLFWDLDKPAGEPRELQGRHNGPILTSAFSPDGVWCVTGGEDRSLRVWKTKDGTLTHTVADAHKAAITSLAFTAKGRLVSAGRDNRLVVWQLADGKPESVNDIDNRGGKVEVLGVSPTGEQGLFDQGKQLSILDLADESVRGVLRMPSAAKAFNTFALFAPDGKTVLTGGTADGLVHLWSNPVNSKQGLASEVRQYVWNEGSSLCAAFDPQARFAVTGTSDNQVLLWALPPASEVAEAGPNAVIRRIDPVYDSSTRQMRIAVDVLKKNDRLIPGDKVNLVIVPR